MLTIVAGLLLAGHATTPWRTYANDRYFYEICYPATMKPGRESDSRDGRVMTGRDGAKLRVYASYNLDRLNARAIASQTVPDGATVTYQRAEKGWGVVSGTVGKRVFYNRVILADDRVAVFEFTYAASTAGIHNAQVKRIAGCFRMLQAAF